MADEQPRKRSRFDQTEPPKRATRFDRRSRSPAARDSEDQRSRSPTASKTTPVNDPMAAAAARAAKINAELAAKKGIQHVDVPPVRSSSAGAGGTSGGAVNTDMYQQNGDYIKDIEINDLRNKYTLTKGKTQEDVSISCCCVCADLSVFLILFLRDLVPTICRAPCRIASSLIRVISLLYWPLPHFVEHHSELQASFSLLPYSMTLVPFIGSALIREPGLAVPLFFSCLLSQASGGVLLRRL